MPETSDKQNTLGQQMFRETALRKMSSADDLDHYLKVTNPSAWILIGAVAALLIAGFIWGLTASLPISTSTTGVVKNGEVVCFLPLENKGSLATTESKVTVAEQDSHVVSVTDDAYSQREVGMTIGSDYATASLDLAQWSYKVVVALPESLSSYDEGDDIPVKITTKEVAPLTYLLGGAK